MPLWSTGHMPSAWHAQTEQGAETTILAGGSVGLLHQLGLLGIVPTWILWIGLAQ